MLQTIKNSSKNAAIAKTKPKEKENLSSSEAKLTKEWPKVLR